MADPAAVRPLTAALIDTEGLPLGSEVARAATGYADELATLARHRRGASLRLTDHHLRMALTGRPEVPHSFAWSALTARRGLGLIAVRSLLAGRARTPTDGVRGAMAHAMRVSHGQRPVSSMEGWLAGLGPAGRAAVAADAVTWATRLWTAVDWPALPSPLIGQDRWWDSPQSSLLALRSRAEVRCAVLDAEGSPVGVHLVTLGGGRRATERDELSVVALTEALRGRHDPPPGRVVGWWPESGRMLRIDVDEAVLRRGLETVARAMGGGDIRAAA